MTPKYVVWQPVKTQIKHDEESRDFKTITMADTIEKTLHSGKTFFDISVTTGQICRGVEADTPESDSNRPIVCDFRTKIWLKSN